MNHSTDVATHPRLAYSPGLDGLRAVACLAVMLYHGDVLHVTGGFLGVTIFLTLSGFLITSLLLDELRVDGRVDLRGFWRRRVHRIFPLLLVVTATSAVWAVATDSLLAQQTIAGAGATLLFATNWLVAGSDMAAGVLNGNWSVALEEQFYVLWPLLLILIYRRTQSERITSGIVLAAALGVVAYRWTLDAGDWRWVWYATHTQADGLLAGCAVALGLRCRSGLVAAGAAAIIGILLFVGYPDSTATMHLFMPAAVLATALLIPWLQEHPGVLGWTPIAALGKRSYGLYLWGCPFVYVARFVMGGHIVVIIASFAATFLVSEVTYRFVEVPMRRRGRRAASGETATLRVFPAPMAA